MAENPNKCDHCDNLRSHRMTLSRKFFLSRKIRTLYYYRFHLPGKNISNNCNFDNNNNRKNSNNTNNNNNSSNSTDNDDDNERPMIVTIIIQP